MNTFDFKISGLAYPFVAPKAVTVAAKAAAIAAEAGTGTGGTTPGTPSTGGGGTTGGSLEWKKWKIDFPDIGAVTDALSNMVDKLEKVIKILQPIMSLIELYINTFSSLSKILSSLLDMFQETLDGLVADIGTAGVYLNVIVPPALLQSSLGTDLMHLSSGGFQGFLGRLQMSLYDTEDKQRPVFGQDAQVGGFIIAIDSESPDAFMTGLKQLANMLDFMKLFGLNLSPPPPRNIRGLCGYFKGKDGKNKFGIQLEWDPPPLFAGSFLLSRSQKSGGELVTVEYQPTSLTGKDGLFSLVKSAIATGQLEWPTKEIVVYKDPKFNGGESIIVPIKPDGGGIYTDYEIPGNVDANGMFTPSADTPSQVFYVVQSMFLDVKETAGPMSAEVKIPVKYCDDSAEVTAVVQHESGMFELMAPGWNKFGSWTSIQMKVMIPFLPDVVAIVDRFLQYLKGMVTDASDSFSDFLKQIEEKILYYVNLLKLVSRMISELEKLLLGQSAAFLMVPPEEGGVSHFMDRVNNATAPSGQPFSGPTGITAGIVVMFGLGTPGLSSDTQAALQLKYTAIEKAFNLLKGLLGA